MPEIAERPVVAFTSAISATQRTFSRSRAAEARETFSDQKEIWRRLLNRLKAPAPKLERSFDRLADVVDGYLDKNPVSVQDGGVDGTLLEGHLPILVADEIDGFQRFFNESPWLAIAAVLSVLRFPIWGGHDIGRDENLDRFMLDPRVIWALHAYQLEMAGVDPRQRVSEAMLEQLQEAKKASEAITTSRTSLLASETEREERFITFLSAGKEQIDAARKQATEAGILLSATRLWRRKAFWHSIRFTAGLIAIGVAVAWGIREVYERAPAMLAALPKKADGEVTYVAVALLTICAIAAGWILRFFGRFVTENMIMQTDASQRRVMLETYLALVGDKDAKMEQADRTLILNAIFRPLPGHQSEDIAPPTLTEVLKSAVPGGKTP